MSNESFRLTYNAEFDMYETQPIPQDLSAYYQSDAYISHTDSKKGMVSFLYQTVKSYALHRKEKLIRNRNGKAGSILDIGAGTGDFLSLCKKRGWNISGVEVDAGARTLASQKGIDLIHNLSEVKDTYDVITLWHVLEHLPDLPRVIRKLNALLRPGGTLVIAVPNYKSFDATYYKEYWAAYDVPRHLWHFSRNSMRKLFQPNLKLIDMRPMHFDAFYVSLLSEQYQSGKKFSLHAFWVGLRSNMLALSSKEYSSLIYVFKKPKNR